MSLVPEVLHQGSAAVEANSLPRHQMARNLKPRHQTRILDLVKAAPALAVVVAERCELHLKAVQQ